MQTQLFLVLGSLSETMFVSFSFSFIFQLFFLGRMGLSIFITNEYFAAILRQNAMFHVLTHECINDWFSFC